MSTTNLAAELERIVLPSGTITYRAAGPADSTGSTVVFVHGLLVDSQLWRRVADILAARGIRSYAPNWPTGSHPIPMNADADLSPQGIAKIIIRFLAAMDLTDVTLVGSDTGGAICQFVVDADHSRLGRLVLTNCDAFDTFPPKEFQELVDVGRHAALLKPMLSALRLTALRHRRNVYGGAFSAHPDPEITRGWIEPGRTSRGIRRDTAKLLSRMRPKELLDVSTRFDRFLKPVALVWGDADPFFPLSLGERLAAAFPYGTIHPIPGASTFVSMEYPNQLADVIAQRTC